RLVQRHDLRGHRPRACDPGARLAHSLYQYPLWPRAFAGYLRGLQETAPPLGLWRFPDRQEALAAFPAWRKPADARPETRVPAGLAELAGRRKPRGARRHPQPDLGADRR